MTLNVQNATICTRKGKDNEIKLFKRDAEGRHLCWKRLKVFVCVRMVSAEASAQEMTAEKEVSMIEYKLSLASSGAVKAPGYEDMLRFGYNKTAASIG